MFVQNSKSKNLSKKGIRILRVPQLLALLLLASACSSPERERENNSSNSEKALEQEPSLLVSENATANSRLETDLLISQPAPTTCGDSVLDDTEGCDDGGKEAGDGCSANCLVIEPGFLCPEPGNPCVPFSQCGDQQVAASEQCDDGNQVDGDGCSNNCQFELGYKCQGEPSLCDLTTCGDGKQEGAETCDDGNRLPFDGCSQICQLEPTCSAGEGCTSACGDGLRLQFKDGELFEECDDGNILNGDGCSADCKIESAGFICRQTDEPELINGIEVVRVPAIFRDFDKDFVDMFNQGESGCGLTKNLVADTLGDDGKPVRATSATNCLSSDESFSLWYRQDDSEAPLNSTSLGEIILFETEDGSFVNRADDQGNQYNGYDGTPFFFPLENFPLCEAGEYSNCAYSSERYEAGIPPQYGGSWQGSGDSYNFHFTTEIVYWFQYDAGRAAKLEFTGDDDVWVFVNGKLAVDLGGTHVPENDSVVIGSATANRYGLIDGNAYEIRVYQAERKQIGSSFRLTLSGFDQSRTECNSVCGDGIIALGEQCDDGKDGNSGGYNRCQEDCTLAGYCGDGIQQADEECDDLKDGNSCSGCRYLVIY